jgi:hypothetical protein
MGEVSPNYLFNLVKNAQEYGLSEDEIAFLSGGLFLAGADTVCCAFTIGGNP